MKNNYFAKLLGLSFLLFTSWNYAQEFKLLTTSDFNLKGAVKSCITLTDYGAEEFYFNEKGLLLRSVTRFNETDYDQSIYEYHRNNLVKKRIENYREGKLDEGVSFIHIYETSITELKKITEQIFNYQRQFIDQFEYYFDEDDLLVKVVRSNDNGIEEREISHTFSEGVLVEETHIVDDQIQKNIKRIEPKKEHEEGDYERLVIEYNRGKPEKATLQFVKNNGQVDFMERMKAGRKNPDKFYALEKTIFEYNEQGYLSSEKLYKKGKLIEGKNYAYEYETEEDGYGNWLRRSEENNEISIQERVIKYFY